jgi:hypothetical protein
MVFLLFSSAPVGTVRRECVAEVGPGIGRVPYSRVVAYLRRAGETSYDLV